MPKAFEVHFIDNDGKHQSKVVEAGTPFGAECIVKRNARFVLSVTEKGGNGGNRPKPAPAPPPKKMFFVSFRDRTGAERADLLEAKSERHAEDILRREGKLVVSISECDQTAPPGRLETHPVR